MSDIEKYLHPKVSLVEINPDNGGDLYFESCDILCFQREVVTAFGNSLPPLFVTYTNIIVGIPPKQVSSVFFIHVFEFKVWVFVFVSIILATIFALLLKFLKANSWHIFLTDLLNIFGLSNDSYHCNFKSYKFSKVVVSIFMFLISSFFSCFLIVYLATTKAKLPFNTIIDLFNQSEYSIYASTGSHVMLSIMEMNLDISKIKQVTQTDIINHDISKVLCESEKSAYILEIFE